MYLNDVSIDRCSLDIRSWALINEVGSFQNFRVSHDKNGDTFGLLVVKRCHDKMLIIKLHIDGYDDLLLETIAPADSHVTIAYSVGLLIGQAMASID